MNLIHSKNWEQTQYKFEKINEQPMHNNKKNRSNQIIFNYNSSMLFQNNKIYISAYFFNLGNLKFITNFLAQKKIQKQLYYMEKSNQLILYTVFGSIQVSSIIGLNNNKQIYKLNTQVLTDSLTINKDESIIIIGSQGQIRFWHNVNCWMYFQTLVCHNMAPIYSLSLNQSETLLISCGYDSCINISTKTDQQWIIKQIIKVYIHGLRLCFINNSQFVFQSIDWKIQVYQSQEKYFVKIKEIAIQANQQQLETSIFQYNTVKDILLKQNGQLLYLINGFKNIEQLNQQSLSFSSNKFTSTLSNTGDYLVVFNNLDNQFIIYMLKKY